MGKKLSRLIVVGEERYENYYFTTRKFSLCLVLVVFYFGKMVIVVLFRLRWVVLLILAREGLLLKILN